MCIQYTYKHAKVEISTYISQATEVYPVIKVETVLDRNRKLTLSRPSKCVLHKNVKVFAQIFSAFLSTVSSHVYT
jgi:hypothetical protein